VGDKQARARATVRSNNSDNISDDNNHDHDHDCNRHGVVAPKSKSTKDPRNLGPGSLMAIFL